MFQFFFKYPSPVFTKGQFVLLSAWPAWLLPVLIVAGFRCACAAHPLAPRDAAPKLQELARLAIWAMQSALVALILVIAVAAGHDGQRAELAAEHHRRRRRRLAQHEHCRQRRQNARSRGPRGARGRRVCRPARSASRRASTGLAAGLHAIDSLNAIAPVEAGNAHRRRPEAARRRNRRPADWRDSAAERWRREYSRTSAAPGSAPMRSRRCAIAACPCTPSASAILKQPTTWRSKM